MSALHNSSGELSPLHRGPWPAELRALDDLRLACAPVGRVSGRKRGGVALSQRLTPRIGTSDATAIAKAIFQESAFGT